MQQPLRDHPLIIVVCLLGEQPKLSGFTAEKRDLRVAIQWPARLAEPCYDLMARHTVSRLRLSQIALIRLNPILCDLVLRLLDRHAAGADLDV